MIEVFATDGTKRQFAQAAQATVDLEGLLTLTDGSGVVVGVYAPHAWSSWAREV